MSIGPELAPTVPAGVVLVAVAAGPGHREHVPHALAEVLGLRAVDVELDHDAWGRPVVTGSHGNLRVSIAHAPNVTLVAAATGLEIGVDVEPLGRNVADWALWRHALTSRELSVVPSAPRARNAALLALWARKEALLKAAGVGLGVDPVTIELDEEGHLVRVPAMLGAASEWSLHELSVRDHVAWIASRPPVCSDSVRVRRASSPREPA